MNAAALQFDAETHTYRVGNEVWPSVTQVLDAITDMSAIPRDVLDAAGQFGTHVHMACDLFNRGRLDEASLDEPLRPYLEAWKRYLRESGVRVLASEVRLRHDVLQYAGTCDLLLKLPHQMGGNVVHVADIKSGAVPSTVGPQTEAYRRAYMAEGRKPNPSPIRFCIQLRGDATYRVHRLTNSGDWNTFVSALNTYRAKSRA